MEKGKTQQEKHLPNNNINSCLRGKVSQARQKPKQTQDNWQRRKGHAWISKRIQEALRFLWALRKLASMKLKEQLELSPELRFGFKELWYILFSCYELFCAINVSAPILHRVGCCGHSFSYCHLSAYVMEMGKQIGTQKVKSGGELKQKLRTLTGEKEEEV